MNLKGAAIYRGQTGLNPYFMGKNEEARDVSGKNHLSEPHVPCREKGRYSSAASAAGQLPYDV